MQNAPTVYIILCALVDVNGTTCRTHHIPGVYAGTVYTISIGWHFSPSYCFSSISHADYMSLAPALFPSFRPNTLATHHHHSIYEYIERHFLCFSGRNGEQGKRRGRGDARHGDEEADGRQAREGHTARVWSHRQRYTTLEIFTCGLKRDTAFLFTLVNLQGRCFHCSWKWYVLVKLVTSGNGIFRQ